MLQIAFCVAGDHRFHSECPYRVSYGQNQGQGGSGPWGYEESSTHFTVWMEKQV